MKICSSPTCDYAGKPQALSNFPMRNTEAGTVHSMCRVCTSAYQAARKANGVRYPSHERPLEAAHLPRELEQSWNVLRAYEVLTQPVMGAGL